MSLPELVVRDRMVSERTVAALRIWAQNCGAVFPRDAELGKIVERARKTLSGASREDLGELQLMFAIGMEPFTAALRAGDHSSKGEKELGEVIFEAYKVISFRTRLNQIYERVVNSDDVWHGVEGHLMRAFRGDTLAPADQVEQRSQSCPLREDAALWASPHRHPPDVRSSLPTWVHVGWCPSTWL